MSRNTIVTTGQHVFKYDPPEFTEQRAPLYIQSILDKIDDFFDNAPAEEVEKVKEGFSVKIKGDVSIEEYLSGFAKSYPYYDDSPSRTYSSQLTVKESNVSFDSLLFEDSITNYGISVDMDEEADIQQLKTIKLAA